jgi:hypothetical protein
MAAAHNTRPSWPTAPADGYYLDDERTLSDRALLDRTLPDQGPAQPVIAEMAHLLRDTRGSMLLGGSVLSAITIGIALEAAFSSRALRPGPAGLVNAALLFGLVVCWLRAVALLAVAGRPVLHALSELRWGSGAPLDPRLGGLTLPPHGTNPDEWTWTRAHLMVGAARLARYRIQLADTWTFITAAGFVVWTAVILLGL